MTQPIPEMARLYMNVIEDRQDHPFIRSNFHQVAWLAKADPVQGEPDFFALDFRAGNYAALAWMTLAAKWATGTWVRLPHPSADLTCPPTPITFDYKRQGHEHKSLNDALAHLAATMPATEQASPSLLSRLRGMFGR